jgi:hypothetical protein
MLAVCALLLVAAEPQRETVEPRDVTYAEMSREVFDVRWILPEGLPVDAQAGSGPAWDLVPKVKQLAALVVEPSAIDAGAPRCLGDVVRAVRRFGGGSKAVERVLAALQVSSGT